ncbi:hypothetical protein NR800_32425 [Corallococcus interemptor]|uniref:porin n=1 Tax=Corallococcus TaxID=83461 RepID=UPI001CC16ED0|nr:porin [Corallococcus sp. AS-1-12]MBZ4335514.1 hypothetical protein [Corallococcus sp. AS-1-12]
MKLASMHTVQVAATLVLALSTFSAAAQDTASASSAGTPVLTDEERQRYAPFALAAGTDEATKRGSEANPDPWSVTNSTQLFSRPTFGELFKVSAETTETGSAYQLSGDVWSLFDPFKNRPWGTLQLSGSYAPDTKEASLGLKFNYSTRVAALLSDKVLDTIRERTQEAVDQCLASANVGKRGVTMTDEEEQAFNKSLKYCEDTSGTPVVNKDLQVAYGFRPNFALGVAAAHDFDTGRFAKFAVNGSMEVPLVQGFSLILNGDVANDRVETGGGRAWTLSGTGAVNYTTPIKLELSGAFKLKGCLTDPCEADGSNFEFGPRIAYPVTKDTVLALNLTWKDTGAGLSDVFSGLALSHSFGFEPSKQN